MTYLVSSGGPINRLCSGNVYNYCTSTTTQKDNNHSYSDTLNLPKTSFSMKANAATREHTLLKDVSELYKWQENNNTGEKWIFHDGPPYANGDLHLGHALNKTLKDFVNRYKILRGYKVNYIPGWDCHGLPIEVKAFESFKKDRSLLKPKDVRKVATDFAKKELKKQLDSFKAWGIVGDWDNHYRTMEPGYEVSQLETFYEMFLKGYIYRGVKPVHWSPSSKTALADAELEYNEQHVSKSIFLKFAMKKVSSGLQRFDNGKLNAVIWTTTPWTIPANLAICVNAGLDYVVVEGRDNERYLISRERLESLREQFKLPLPIVEGAEAIKGADLFGTVTAHPMYGRDSPILLGEHVVTGSGTGLVHTAPGHGVEDFAICQQHKIEPISPVDDNGCFTEQVGRFAGLEVLGAGNDAVIEELKSLNSVVHSENYVHKYPYDWRTKKPTIIRTTRQWFVDLSGVQSLAVKSIENINMVPPSGSNRLSSMVGKRNDWCISRQRYWGVPIPVFYEKSSGDHFVNQETMSHVLELFKKHGSDCWFSMETAELLPSSMADKAHLYEKGMDTMDVWFDSGTSWRGVLVARGVMSMDESADIYLEGSDQHRGWFQSSLLTSICARGIAPYKNVVTHGFLLDEKGNKQSKSLGNTIAPSLIIHGGNNKTENPAYGVDMLRMWIATSDYTKDISVGPTILTKVLDNVKKIRNTVRYMLGANFDFQPEKHSVPYHQLSEIDKYALHKVYVLSENATKYYDQFHFQKVTQEVINFCHEISAFYFDIIKQRLYVEAPDNNLRRSSQTVLFEMLDVVNKIIAPIAIHTCEDIYKHQYKYREPTESVFTQGWTRVKPEWNNAQLLDQWGCIITVRDLFNRLLQEVRDKGIIGRPDETMITLKVSSPFYDHLKSNQSQLEDIFCVSKVELVHDQSVDIKEPEQPSTSRISVLGDGGDFNCEQSSVISFNGQLGLVDITIRKSDKHKCPRCWRHQSEQESHVCPSCVSRLSLIKK
ncbi:isoleucyl-tRNA synthetase [Heterostelium album PN500]|uniref:isoleucine--tRNA ligase n=1 Tax=Heterostelium pallidum (strain ATCC 26659 / Pp 5 / PN500) TaxID=670386 RepID=D3B8D9_HETP5|nr:isoleucyl-tRNA synthetase [Heterostelium album PN500]EFA82307.1 isoleucyl-tRNA synthetase [Heterostelium album PN500]|eukprot:XP_020434424.1 isoleucyl-tRNA synthetase [Heterostelium album PN500]